MSLSEPLTISGKRNGQRIDSRVLEEEVQEAVARGHRNLRIEAFGQHGIGGRLWKAGGEAITVRVTGHPGQRAGAMGFANTLIDVEGPASDDVGWLNAGARIIVRGNAGNGVANAMAQGVIWVAGNIGARGMTMTKHNPRFEPPQLWTLGSVGDYFGEFMAGGVAVVCGLSPQDPENVLGHRPLVGMVGGKVFFRGPIKGFSGTDARRSDISDADWRWLTENLRIFLERIGRIDAIEPLSDRDQWQLLVAKSPRERTVGAAPRSMAAFRKSVWNAELGSDEPAHGKPGFRPGLIGDLTDLDAGPIGLIVTGDMRRYVPVWENGKYLAPCEASCPTGIPVQQRWRLIREGRVDEAVDLALSYTPFPAAVCGYLCPNLCMQGCTRQSASMPPVDVAALGRASIDAAAPSLPPLSGHRIAVIGGGPGGISVAWQLRRLGHEAVIHDRAESLGGKMVSVIPGARIPPEVVAAELARIREVIPHAHMTAPMEKADIDRLKSEYDFIVVAVGAQKPRRIPVPGGERMITALDFLLQAKASAIRPGKRVVIIGAGNVGCDVATEAHRLGAGEITLVDIQEPASFGREREHAVAAGAKFRWPFYTKEITAEGVVAKDGEVIPADTVIISIGDAPDLDFLPESVKTERGFIQVDDSFRTTDPAIFAVGDAARIGLLTDAIGAGRRAAAAIDGLLKDRPPEMDRLQVIDKRRVTLEYFDPRVTIFESVDQCGAQCASCGACRDCGVCVAICPQAAITRRPLGETDYEYVVDPERCIGCGFCAGACPCGIWNLVENTPIG